MTRKESNRLIYQENLNKVIEYIHNHLDSKIDLKTLAEISNFSPYHFHRISRAMLGEPIGTYISRTRIETAAKLIRYSGLSIEDITYSVGFEAPSSLSKAFKNHYGISPSEYRKDKFYTIKTTNIMETTLNIKKPKIVEVKDKECIYYSMRGPYHSLDYRKAWATLWNEIKKQRLFSFGLESIGLPHDNPHITDDDKIRYDACITIKKKATPTGDIGVKTLKGGKFAVFLYQGPYTNFPQVYDYIFNDWLMDSTYTLRDAPAREKYKNNPQKTDENKLKTEIYLPIN